MKKDSSEIKKLTFKINKWVSERGWDKFQKPKDLAISLCLEAAEVLEHFQWKAEKEVSKYVMQSKGDIADELADVAIYLFKLADKINVNLGVAIEQKLIKQAKKYPVELVLKEKDLKKYQTLKTKNRKEVLKLR